MFALDTDPLVSELVPVAQELAPTLSAVQALSPELRDPVRRPGPADHGVADGFPRLRRRAARDEPLLAALDPFLGQLNPILNWLSLHQQLMSDFISVGAVGVAAKTTAYGGTGVTCGGTPCGHYLRQFSPIGPQTNGLAGTRDVNSRGNTYPPSLWLADPRASRPGASSRAASRCPHGTASRPVRRQRTPPATATNQACWVAPTLPGAKPGQIPHILTAHYPNK